MQYGNEATSAVDPNVDTELEFTPGDIGQAIVPTAGKEAGNEAITTDVIRGGDDKSISLAITHLCIFQHSFSWILVSYI